jgi:hypothetical protein
MDDLDHARFEAGGMTNQRGKSATVISIKS